MRVYKLVIDADREDHIARHQVRVEEVEEAVFDQPFVRRTRQRGAPETIYRVIGRTAAGRYLTIFLGPRGRGVFGLVTARDSSAAERRAYESHGGHN